MLEFVVVINLTQYHHLYFIRYVPINRTENIEK